MPLIDSETRMMHRDELARIKSRDFGIPMEHVRDAWEKKIPEYDEHKHVEQGAERRRMDDLKADIHENGIQEPLLVTHFDGYSPEVQNGHHRWVAGEELGHTHYPVTWENWTHKKLRGRTGMYRQAAMNLPDDAEFHFHPSLGKHDHHKLEMHGEGQELGSLSWGRDGDISGVETHHRYQHRGIATALYSKAHDLAQKHSIAAPGSSVFQTPSGRGFREHFDSHERPDVGHIPTHEYKGAGADSDDIRKHMIEDHGNRSSAQIINDMDDESVHSWHDQVRKYSPCGFERTSMSRQASLTFEHYGPIEGKHYRIFATRPDGSNAGMHEYKIQDGALHPSTFYGRDKEAGQALHQEMLRRHPDLPLADDKPKQSKPEREPETFYHGTVTPNLKHVRPAEQRGRVTFAHDTDRSHAYATSSEDDAWHYAEMAEHATTRGRGRVYEVRPKGPYEKDPAVDQHGRSRSNFSNDYRSQHGWTVVRELRHPNQKEGAMEPEDPPLRFHSEEFQTGGSLYPTEEHITAVHPDHGTVGKLQVWRGRRANSKMRIKRLEVDPKHRRKGYGSALMDHLQEKYPKSAIDHGDRTDDGKAWWDGYGKGKADKRGRTADRRPFVRDATARRACEGCGGVGDLPNGSECGACDGSGCNPECPCGTPVVKDGDEWTHADGSVSHDGPWYGQSVAELMRRCGRQEPTQRIFGPTFGLDHRLWDGDQLKPEIRDDILNTFEEFCERHHYVNCDSWSKLVFFGSEASNWTSENLEGNGDFDLSLGVEFDKFRLYNSSWRDESDADIASALTEQMHAELNNPNKYFGDAGPFDQTWFCNELGYRIEQIKPYAAYDVTHKTWIVRPPELPGWSIEDFPQGHPLVIEIHALATEIRAVLQMPEPYRSQQGDRLWHYVHDGRSQAFSDQGEGWADTANVLEKAMDQLGLWDPLVEIHFAAKDDPHRLDAPVNWSNDPAQVA